MGIWSQNPIGVNLNCAVGKGLIIPSGVQDNTESKIPPPPHPKKKEKERKKRTP